MARKFTIFPLFYFVFEGKLQVQAPHGGLIFGGAIYQRVFCVTILGGLYLEGLVRGGAYFRNFTINHITRTMEMESNELECLEQAILLQGLVLLELKGLRIISELD